MEVVVFSLILSTWREQQQQKKIDVEEELEEERGFDDGKKLFQRGMK